jgi:hypothetical protein
MYGTDSIKSPRGILHSNFAIIYRRAKRPRKKLEHISLTATAALL